MRTNPLHRANVQKIKHSTSKTERAKSESLYGCRYSVLLDLPYFDPIRMLIIDPMHNLFLDSAKYVLKNLWMDREILTSSKLAQIQGDIIQHKCTFECKLSNTMSL